MKKIIRIAFVCLVCFFAAVNFAFAQGEAVAAASRRTALRYLERALDCLVAEDWENAVSYAEIGLAYDNSIADLWYVSAAAQKVSGAPVATVLPLVENALRGGGKWAGYNKDSARVLCAELLCDTGSYEQALKLLDEMPFIYTADSELIRAKAYYRMGTEDSIALARQKINSARRIYEDDVRFARLFFRHEYDLCGENGVVTVQDETVRRIAASFAKQIPLYDKNDGEIEIFAAVFAMDEDKRRLLQAFAANGRRHPLFAIAAVQTGIMTESEAVDYFFSFENEPVDLYYLSDFVATITDAEARTYLASVLNAFEGTLLVDTNKDLRANAAVEYARGRPQKISWDRECDGAWDWTIFCDFGVPISVTIGNSALQIEYGTYPAVVSAVLESKEFGGIYKYAADTFFWTPCQIGVYGQFAFLEGCEFFVPTPVTTALPPLPKTLIENASHYIASSKERSGAKSSFALVDGNVVTAEYFSGETVYARAIFQNGLPLIRTLDNDGDGIFETTQYFGHDPENKLLQSETERTVLRDEIFNVPEMASGIYLKRVETDSDGDGSVDFVEDYLEHNGMTASWYENDSGNWTMRYERLPQKPGENLREVSSFYKTYDNSLVSVAFVNNYPSEVVSGNVKYPVTRGGDDKFFWIGTKSTAEIEQKIRSYVSQNNVQGMSLMYEALVDFDSKGETKTENPIVLIDDVASRFFVIRIGEIIFAEQIK